MVALFRCRPTVRCRVRLLSWLVPPCADRELAARSDAVPQDHGPWSAARPGQVRADRGRRGRVRAQGRAAGCGRRLCPAALLPGAIRPVGPPIQPGAGSDTEGRTQAGGNARRTRPSHACRSFSGESRRRVGSARGASACRSASSITWLNVRPLRAALIFACTTPAGACPVTSKSELKRRSAAARRARLALTRCVTTVAGCCRHRACIQ